MQMGDTGRVVGITNPTVVEKNDSIGKSEPQPSVYKIWQRRSRCGPLSETVPRNSLNGAVWRDRKESRLSVANPDLCVVVRRNRKDVATRNAVNRVEAAALRVENATSGRHPQTSAI